MKELVFVESRTARQDRLADLDDTYALLAINKAKALLMAMWQGKGVATTEQMSEYYEVSVDTVQTVLKRNREELESDGLKTLKGKDLKGAMSTLNIGQDGVSWLTIWTPRAALRLGMLLRDSLVAQKVRNILLDIAERQPTEQPDLEQRVQAIEAQMFRMQQPQIEFKPKQKSLLQTALQHPNPELKEIPCRTKVRKLITQYCGQTDRNYQNVYREFYEQYNLTYSYNVYRHCEKTGEKCKLTQMEKDGEIDRFHQMVTILTNPQSQAA